MDSHLAACEVLGKYGQQYRRPPRWFVECEHAARGTTTGVATLVTTTEIEASSSSIGATGAPTPAHPPGWDLLWRLCVQAARAVPAWSPERWRGLVKDVLTVRQSALAWVPRARAYQLLLEQLLVAGQFDVVSGTLLSL